MKVTIDDLKKIKACKDGIADFVAYGSEATIEITKEWQIEFLKTSPLKKYWGWSVYVGLIPSWSMHKIDFSEADLSGANLRWANLSETNLSKADLSGANLRWANLSDANLSDANLSKADLRWADLTGANLKGANMYNIIKNEFTVGL